MTPTGGRGGSGPRARRRPSIAPSLLAAVRAEAEGFFRDARGSHDWGHTERVRRLCLRIGRKEGADLGVLELAALLHDVGRGAEDASNGQVCHARAGAALAERILARHGLDPGLVREVAGCIRKVLFDADKLDSIGAVGIGRAFLFAGEVGARLHDPAIDIRRTRPYTRDDTAYREFLVKLRRVKGRIFTREGRRIAAERHRFMVAFFERLNKETEGAL